MRDRKAYHAEYYRKNRERLRAREREYATTQAGRAVASRAQKAHRQTALGKATQLRHSIKWKRLNPEKKRAHDRLADAIRRGVISRQACEVCGTFPADGHHEDYSQPLVVRWLCRIHHTARHR